jgi:hypothetical protein
MGMVVRGIKKAEAGVIFCLKSILAIGYRGYLSVYDYTRLGCIL